MDRPLSNVPTSYTLESWHTEKANSGGPQAMGRFFLAPEILLQLRSQGFDLYLFII